MSMRPRRFPVSDLSASPRRLLLEALGWTFGYLLAQGIVLLGLLAVLMLAAWGWRWPEQDELLRWVLAADLDRSFLLVGAPVLGAPFLILLAVRLREGREFRQRIGWRLPTADETIYALATIAPMALLGNLVFGVADCLWRGDETLWPFAAAIQKSSLDRLYGTFEGVSYPVLIVAMALAPAVAEELVFRGVLGRRLTAQWGLARGVLASSVCFALVHGSPPHAIATFPVAVLLHLLYLQTGTIWTPILVHFGNNLLAISMVRFDLASHAPVSPIVALGMCGYLAAILVLLKARTGNVTLASVRFARN